MKKTNCNQKIHLFSPIQEIKANKKKPTSVKRESMSGVNFKKMGCAFKKYVKQYQFNKQGTVLIHQCNQGYK